MKKKILSTTVEIPSYNEKTKESYVDQAIVDVTYNRDFDFNWLVEETKKRNGWKRMTKSRRNMLFRNAYYLGRNGVLPPQRPSIFDSIPRVKNKGLTTNFKVIKGGGEVNTQKNKGIDYKAQRDWFIKMLKKSGFSKMPKVKKWLKKQEAK